MSGRTSYQETERSPTGLFAPCHRRLQDAGGTRRLADAQENGIVHEVLTASELEFIRSRDMFFLSTVDPDGRPTVSYKGGDPGFVEIEDGDILFPCYNGNGMFLSLGNLTANREVGLLFIDFEKPNRLRVQGHARLMQGADPARPGSEGLVRVTPTHVFVNCPRYIHRYRKESPSRYVPAEGLPAPVASWKRIDYVRDVLSEDDRRGVDEVGTISQAEYDYLVARGEA